VFGWWVELRWLEVFGFGWFVGFGCLRVFGFGLMVESCCWVLFGYLGVVIGLWVVFEFGFGSHYLMMFG
jgi:hypothetical protein